jgi:acyl dehydratase
MAASLQEVMAPIPTEPAPIMVGESVSHSVRYTREQIAEFARLSGDSNPVHSDQQAAQRARYGEIIASGQQTVAQLMGLVASHFSRADDGIEREMLCLNFNFAFKLPIFAEQEIKLGWQVSSVDWNRRLDGWIGLVDGSARVAGRACVVGRGTVLVKAVPVAHG